MSLPSEGQSLTANQISSTYLNSRLRYNYFRIVKNKRPAYWNSTSGFIFDHFTVTAVLLSVMLMNFIQTHGGNMTSYRFCNTAAAAAHYYFRFRICWCQCLQKVNVYQQTRRHISIHGWYITIFGLENKRPPYCNSTSGFDLDHFAVICMSFCIRLPNFVQIRALTVEIWRHIQFSRWRPLNTTSGFVSANQISSTYFN